MGAHDLHRLLAGYDDKSAQAVCTFAYSEGPGHDPVVFQGRTDVCIPEPKESASDLVCLILFFRADLYQPGDLITSVSART